MSNGPAMLVVVDAPVNTQYPPDCTPRFCVSVRLYSVGSPEVATSVNVKRLGASDVIVVFANEMTDIDFAVLADCTAGVAVPDDVGLSEAMRTTLPISLIASAACAVATRVELATAVSLMVFTKNPLTMDSARAVTTIATASSVMLKPPSRTWVRSRAIRAIIGLPSGRV